MAQGFALTFNTLFSYTFQQIDDAFILPLHPFNPSLLIPENQEEISKVLIPFLGKNKRN